MSGRPPRAESRGRNSGSTLVGVPLLAEVRGDWRVRTHTPVVAAVHGAAVGGGLGLALTADFRMAAPEARFSANFARLGFHQGFGLSVTVPRLVGPQVAADLLFTGRRVPGEEAVRLGLADGPVARDRMRYAAHGMAREIAMSVPLAVRSIRTTLRGGLTDQVEAAVAHEHREQARLQQTADFAEGAGPWRSAGFWSSEASDACYPAWLGAVSSAWLERLLDTQEVRGSNPLRPTELTDVGDACDSPSARENSVRRRRR